MYGCSVLALIRVIGVKGHQNQKNVSVCESQMLSSQVEFVVMTVVGDT